MDKKHRYLRAMCIGLETGTALGAAGFAAMFGALAVLAWIEGALILFAGLILAVAAANYCCLQAARCAIRFSGEASAAALVEQRLRAASLRVFGAFAAGGAAIGLNHLAIRHLL